jgi:nucleoside-diphosphate-sugar epimerase
LLTLVIKGENNNAYNVGSSNEISIKNLAEKIKTVLAPQCSIIYKKTSPSSILGLNRYVPCTLKMQDLGCKDWTSLEQGIKDTAMFNSELSSSQIPKSALKN